MKNKMDCPYFDVRPENCPSDYGVPMYDYSYWTYMWIKTKLNYINKDIENIQKCNDNNKEIKINKLKYDYFMYNSKLNALVDKMHDIND
jgi:hypothetical protein